MGKKVKPRIFICYRRGGEGAGFGGRIADKLVKHFGDSQCFRDIEDIEKGTDFVESIKRATSICDLLIVVIGPDWTSMTDVHGNIRLQDPNDFVRLEVSTALKRDIRVMPILVGGAKVPSEEQLPDDLKALVRRQSHELTDQRWNYDTDELIRSIEAMGIKGMSPEEQEARKRKQKIFTAVVLTTFILLITVGIGFMFKSQPNDKDINRSGNELSPTTVVIPKQEISAKKIPAKVNKNFQPLPVSDKSASDYSTEIGSIKNSIQLASSLESLAMATLDITPLGQVFMGDALQNYQTVLSEYYQMGIYSLNIMEAQTFGDIAVFKEGNKLMAEAEVLEIWSTHTHRTSDHLCLVHQPSHNAPQTVYLEKKNDSWYISSIMQHNTSMPTSTQCGMYDCPLLAGLQ
ncbi:hypothetical protein GCM10007383_22450 [Arenibacter certesii]|uniref:TIR domain-containing protein n=2 Tax=Arenibacter certesii TaxID=228955 RepID=A0A918IXL4_9FLAO|nr:hypothetical protein GCM10007383_22450 [Arenibacter certesii]